MEKSEQLTVLVDGVIIPVFTFLISYLAYPHYANFLKKKGIIQIIRREGPDIHSHKEGTPIMGGLFFIIVTVILSMLRHPTMEIKIVCVSTLLFVSIGFLDDILRSLKKNWEGLKPYQKLSLQLLASVIILFIIQKHFFHLNTFIPFLNERIYLGSLYIPFAILVLVGTVNAVNLTDGVDGLAGSIFISTAIPYSLILWKLGWSSSNILYISLFSIIAFLWYNFKPAKIFMGDTGSMGLGGLIGTIAVLTGTELFLPFIAFIYMVETMSVIIQVGYYKMRKRRIFKMAPLHHHFEIIGWSEEKIVFRLSLINLMISLVVLKDVFS